MEHVDPYASPFPISLIPLAPNRGEDGRTPMGRSRRMFHVFGYTHPIPSLMVWAFWWSLIYEVIWEQASCNACSRSTSPQ